MVTRGHHFHGTWCCQVKDINDQWSLHLNNLSPIQSLIDGFCDGVNDFTTNRLQSFVMRKFFFAKCGGLSVCHMIFGHSFQAIVFNFFVHAGDRPRTAEINCGEDPNSNPRNFFSDSSPLREKRHVLHNVSRGWGWIPTKLGGQVGCATRTNWFDFAENLNPHPDPRNFQVILHHWEIRTKTIETTMSQKVTDGFCSGQVGCVTRMNSFNFGEHSNLDQDTRILQWFFIERWGQKRWRAWYFKKLWTNFDKTMWMSWFDDRNKPIRFWLRSHSIWNHQI